MRWARKAAMGGAALVTALAACLPRAERQYPFVTSGIVRNGFLGHGAKYEDTIAFSPDSGAVAYLWSEGRYGPALPGDERGRPRTLEESIHLRWFEVAAPAAAKSVLVETIDLGPQGEQDFNLESSVYFSPDSTRLAAVSPSHLILVDRATGKSRALGGSDLHFGGARWRSAHQLVYATQAGTRLSFWTLDVDRPDAGRRVLEEEVQDVLSREDLATLSWSPSGRYVVVGEAIADLDRGTRRAYDVPGLWSFHTWDPVGSRLLFHDAWAEGAGKPGGSKTVLVEAETGETVDLSAPMRAAVGEKTAIGLGFWMTDGRHIVVHDADHTQYHVLEVDPPRVVLSVHGPLFPSTRPGWLVFRDRGDRCEWIDLQGRRGGRLPGWPPQWTWAPDGRHAAEVREEKLVVVDVPPPTGP
jgi:hypothetical protein